MRVAARHIAIAASLWCGRISQKKAAVYRSDSEHFAVFSNPRVLTYYDLRRFIEFANVSPARRATGGYTIKWRFSGSRRAWVSVIRVALLRARRLKTEAAAIRLADALANSRTTAARMPLGVSAASKLLFFGAPHLPIFVFDKFTRIAAGVRPPRLYGSWHRTAMAMYRHANLDERALRRLRPPDAPEGWFRRRCFDIALVQKGQAM